MQSLTVMNGFYLEQEQRGKTLSFDTTEVSANYKDFLGKYQAILLYLCKQLQLCLAVNSEVYEKYIYVTASYSSRVALITLVWVPLGRRDVRVEHRLRSCVDLQLRYRC